MVGAILSDSYWGKYRTILRLSLIYCLGMLLLAVSSLPSLHSAALFIGGLVLAALGTGGIKPCVSAFGGDQFRPSQVAAIAVYFSVFYFAINAGSVLSMLITPILRQNVHCFGEGSCYPLAFGLPAALMLVATVVFVSGSVAYVKHPPAGNVSLQVLRVLVSAGWARGRAMFRRRDGESRGSSWLDYADMRQNSPAFVRDVRILLGILAVFAPISLFWALYDQQGSRWTYQALLMDGHVGPFRIKPEQMGVFNAALILLLIPAFERIIYPGLAHINLTMRPLGRIFCGMALATVSFVLAAGLQFAIDTRGSFSPSPDEPGTRICTDGCIHILWQVPQYIVLTCGEVMLSITGLEFAYSQAPGSIKSVCSSAWLLTVAAGNLIVIVFNELDPVSWFVSAHWMAWNFVFWAGVLATGTMVFAVIASRYQYVNVEELHMVDSIEADEK